MWLYSFTSVSTLCCIKKSKQTVYYKSMKKLAVVLVWATLVIVGLVIYLPMQADKRTKVMAKSCDDRMHYHFSQESYGKLDYRDAYTLELQARAQCIVQYPLN